MASFNVRDVVLRVEYEVKDTVYLVLIQQSHIRNPEIKKKKPNALGVDHNDHLVKKKRCSVVAVIYFRCSLAGYFTLAAFCHRGGDNHQMHVYQYSV